jgi:hypothetical protein
MVVEHELAAELQVELVLVPVHPFENEFRLSAEIFFVVESGPAGHLFPSSGLSMVFDQEQIRRTPCKSKGDAGAPPCFTMCRYAT